MKFNINWKFLTLGHILPAENKCLQNMHLHVVLHLLQYTEISLFYYGNKCIPKPINHLCGRFIMVQCHLYELMFSFLLHIFQYVTVSNQRIFEHTLAIDDNSSVLFYIFGLPFWSLKSFFSVFPCLINTDFEEKP